MRHTLFAFAAMTTLALAAMVAATAPLRLALLGSVAMGALFAFFVALMELRPIPEPRYL